MNIIKLNQIIAIEKGVKNIAEEVRTRAYQILQKPDLFRGHSRTYTPKIDGDEQLPPDNKTVPFQVSILLNEINQGMLEYFDITYAKEFGNTSAVADIVLENGDVLLSKVPVTYLLFLEKQLEHTHTLISKIPLLDFAENWTFDQSSGLFKSDRVDTLRTKKVERPLVLYDATKDHPAQVKTVTEDIPVGTWTTVKVSSEYDVKKVKEMALRVLELQRAVKKAREQANSIEVAQPKVAEKILDYIFA